MSIIKNGLERDTLASPHRSFVFSLYSKIIILIVKLDCGTKGYLVDEGWLGNLRSNGGARITQIFN